MVPTNTGLVVLAIGEKMTLATAFRYRRSASTSDATRRPLEMFVLPSATRDSTASFAEAFPSPDIRVSRISRLASFENDTILRRSAGPRLSMTNPMACFSSASFLPSMLPLTSSTVTRSSGARTSSAATPPA